MADTGEYLPPSQAAERYAVSTRTLERWARDGLVRTQQNPIRKNAKLYHADDVARLAATVQPARPADPSDTDTAPTTPTTELMPPSEVLTMLNDTQRRLEAAMHEAGRLKGQLESQQRLLEDRDMARQELTQAQTERDRLKAQLDRIPLLLRWLFRQD